MKLYFRLYLLPIALSISQASNASNVASLDNGETYATTPERDTKPILVDPDCYEADRNKEKKSSWLSMRDSKECTDTFIDGVEFIEFSCLYPFLDKMYIRLPDSVTLATQKAFFSIYQFMERHQYTPVYAVLLYAIAICLGKKYMENRKPYSFRRAMAYWNLSLSIFSIICVVRIVPHFVHNLTIMSFRDNLCFNPEPSYGRNTSGMYCMLFVLSKFAELFDTFFIVAHRKPLIFLHWYHHITVLLFSWLAYMKRSPASVIFAFVNAGVHFVMYGYYFLMTLRVKPKWINPMWITVAQITQMVIGVSVTFLSLYYSSTSNNCSTDKTVLVSALAMYTSYLILFLQFFIQRFVKGNKNATFAGKSKVI